MQKCYLIVVLVVLGISRLLAQWSGDPALNTPVCTSTNSQMYPAVVTDGAGGVITAWYDERNSTSAPNLYAQRVGPTGAMRWASNGVAIAPVASFQSAPVMLPDGHGGAIIAWTDSRNGATNSDIYAQRIDSSGGIQWGTTGDAVCSATGTQISVQIVSDGVGGTILVWEDMRGGLSNPLLYAQRIDASGVPQWGANGVVICTVAASHLGRALITDGANGAIIVWEDLRNGFGDIFAQRVNGSGAVQWTATGVPICTADNYQITPQLCADGAGGAFITWADHRAAFSYNIYAQRINSSGTPQWTADGIALCTASGGESGPLIVADSTGTAVIAWSDGRSSTNSTDVYAQRVNLSGTALWTTNGLLICGATGAQDVTSIATDGIGGVMLTWDDNRIFGIGSPDIYGQRVTSSGVVQWTIDGIPISTATDTQQDSHFVTYGSGGAIVVWDDYRHGQNNPDIYCARVNANGTLTGVGENSLPGGVSPLAFSLDQNYPNPFNPSTTIRYGLPHKSGVQLKVYNTLGQEVATLVQEEQDAGYHEVQFNGSGLASGVYFYRIQAGSFVQARKILLLK